MPYICSITRAVFISRCSLVFLILDFKYNYNTDPAKYPDASLEDAVNFCRNPDLGETVWCYTMNPEVRWEYCDVEMCTGESRHVHS